MDRKSQQGHPEMSEIPLKDLCALSQQNWEQWNSELIRASFWVSSFLYRKTTLGRNSGGTNTSLFKNMLHKILVIVFNYKNWFTPWIIFCSFWFLWFSPWKLLQSVENWHWSFHFKQVILFHKLIFSSCWKKFSKGSFGTLHFFEILWECGFWVQRIREFEYWLRAILGSSVVALSFVLL